MEKHKIYCFNNGGSPGWYMALALGDDGTSLAGHICSSDAYIPHDLGVTSAWKHDFYDAHFGAGNWEAEYVADPNTHAGLSELKRKLEKAEANV